MTPKRTEFCAALFFLWLFPALALASPLDLFGISPRSIGMGGGGVASARDYSAIYLNPGRLGFVQSGLGLHFTASFDALKITLDKRPTGVDVPSSIYNAYPSLPGLATSDLPQKRHNTTYDPNIWLLSGGAVYDFGLYWLRAGFAFQVPLNYIAGGSFHFIDEREQYFSNTLNFQFLNRRATTPALMPSLAFRPLKWLSFGATAHIYGHVLADARMYVPDAGQLGTVYASMDMALRWRASAIVGLQIDPLPWFGFGFSFRDKSYYRLRFTNQTFGHDFKNASDANNVQRLDYAFSYSPRKLSHGWRFDVEPVTISLDGSWLRWSEYRAEIPLTYLADPRSYKDLEELMLRREGVYKLSLRDTFELRGGVEWRATPWLDWRIGGGFIQTPVKNQDGRANLVDNDRIDTATGFTFYLPWVKGLAVDLHVQVQTLIPRHTVKDPGKIIDELPDDTKDAKGNLIASTLGLQTNNPGYPGYRSKGLIGTVGFGLSYTFPLPEKEKSRHRPAPGDEPTN